MIREPKNVDFCTTGRHLSEEDFTKISEWIKMQKIKDNKVKTRRSSSTLSADEAGKNKTLVIAK